VGSATTTPRSGAADRTTDLPGTGDRAVTPRRAIVADMPDHAMVVVDRAAAPGYAVLGFTSYPVPGPFSVGAGDLNLLCGDCAFVVVAGTSWEAVPRMLIRCPGCGRLNLPADPAG
jgi:hypothetical protein